MAARERTTVKLVGLILLVGGIGLAFWGYQLSGAFTAQIAKGLTGAYPDGVMFRYLGGGLSTVAGLYLLIKG